MEPTNGQVRGESPPQPPRDDEVHDGRRRGRSHTLLAAVAPERERGSYKGHRTMYSVASAIKKGPPATASILRNILGGGDTYFLKHPGNLSALNIYRDKKSASSSQMKDAHV